MTGAQLQMQCPECDWERQYWDEDEMLGELLLEHGWNYAQARKWIKDHRPGGSA